MNVGIFRPTWLDLSVAGYLDNVVQELEKLGVEPRLFATPDPLPPDCDVYWDPRLTGGTQPWHRLMKTSRPIVATVHGASPLTVPPWESYHGFGDAARGLWGVAKRLYHWRRWRYRCAALITSSQDAKKELIRRFFLKGENIVVIQHGVDHEIFRPPIEKDEVSREKDEVSSEPFFLHVAAYQPIKNLDRILRAFKTLRNTHEGVRLVAVVPHYRGTRPAMAGLELITEPKSHRELAALYRRALAFIFPSLSESFGMPILEAMACGCPVVTSNSSACAETAADAAWTVNPRSTGAIREAMERLLLDGETRTRLAAAGLEHARGFTWYRAAREHLEVFRQAARRAARES